LQGNAGQVAVSMRHSATKRGLSKKQCKNIDRCAMYLLNHRAYLHYVQNLARGYPIATGVIEGACRHLVKDRMDVSCARWSLRGAESVLRLRSLAKSGDLEDYWAFHIRAEKRWNHDVRCDAEWLKQAA
jgi:hypothetical protein